ncbi:MAG: PEGA domain-containing protein [Opitutaceae bacterium]
MTREQAAEILGVSPHASVADRDARHDELRRQLEDKLAKAPTPGLREKYRASLAELEEAHATLQRSDDTAALPVLKKQPAATHPQTAATSAAPTASVPAAREHQSPVAKPKAKSNGKEFMIVAFIAVLVVAAGGWFVMKTRAENAEKARIAAEQKAAADRQAEEARVAAEARKKAEEDEKARSVAAAKAEQERLEKLAAQVRVGFSEARLLWQQAERAEREAQRELDDLKSSARSMRDLYAGQRREIELRLEAQADYQRWLTDHLARHPARRGEVRTDELLNARQTEAAAEALAQYQQALAGLTEEIAAHRPNPADLFGSLAITSTPPGVTWELNDAFGQAATGTTPGSVSRAGVGPATVTFRRPGWEAYTVTAQVAARKEARAEFTYRPARLNVTSNPAGAEVYMDAKLVGRTPLALIDLPVKAHVIEVRLADYKSRSEKVTLQPGDTNGVDFDLPRLTDQELIAEFSTRWKGTWAGTLRSTPFFCRFEAGATKVTEWDGAGKYANRPIEIGLSIISRNPLQLNRFLIVNGRQYIMGSFAEENGELVWYARAASGSRLARVPLSRSSN